jgi:hypothetical protein
MPSRMTRAGVCSAGHASERGRRRAIGATNDARGALRPTRGTVPDARPGCPRVASRTPDCRPRVERVFSPFPTDVFTFRCDLSELRRDPSRGSQLSLEATPRGVPLEACAGEMQCLAVAPGPVPTVSTARPRVNVGVSRARVGARGAGVRLAASAGTSPRDAFSTSRPIYPPGDHGLTPRPRVSRRSPPRSFRTPQTTRRTAR